MVLPQRAILERIDSALQSTVANPSVREMDCDEILAEQVATLTATISDLSPPDSTYESHLRSIIAMRPGRAYSHARDRPDCRHPLFQSDRPDCRHPLFQSDRRNPAVQTADRKSGGSPTPTFRPIQRWPIADTPASDEGQSE